MNKKHDDGLEWLRQIRRNMAEKCGNDIRAINECYRVAAARVPHQSYRHESSPKPVKRKILANG
jgi:hypothetical protein